MESGQIQVSVKPGLAHRLDSPIAGLYATPAVPLPFAPTVDVRAFVLERAQGNLIVYNAPGIAALAGEIAALGSVARQVVNHAHEGMYGPQGLEIGVWVGERDREETARSLAIAGTFSQRHTIDDDFEVIPTPGHTPGTTAFLWDTGRSRLLFTGDMLWIDKGNWRAVLLSSSDRDAYLDSLVLLRDVEFDVLVPWGALRGGSYIDAVSHGQARQKIDAVIARVSAGENG